MSDQTCRARRAEPRRGWTGARALVALAVAIGCGGGGSSPSEPTESSSRRQNQARVTTGDEVVPPPPGQSLRRRGAPARARRAGRHGPARQPHGAERAVDPRRRQRCQSRFTFDGFHRGWLARLPHGRQRLLTPVYGDGRVYLGGGFSSHAVLRARRAHRRARVGGLGARRRADRGDPRGRQDPLQHRELHALRGRRAQRPAAAGAAGSATR